MSETVFTGERSQRTPRNTYEAVTAHREKLTTSVSSYLLQLALHSAFGVSKPKCPRIQPSESSWKAGVLVSVDRNSVRAGTSTMLLAVPHARPLTVTRGLLCFRHLSVQGREPGKPRSTTTGSSVRFQQDTKCFSSNPAPIPGDVPLGLTGQN